MNIVIFEDDAAFAADLQNMIETNTSCKVVLNTSNSADVLKHAAFEHQQHLYFLDIVCGNFLSGFTIAENITATGRGDEIVFITSYPNKILTNTFYKIRALNTILKKSPYLASEVLATVEYAKSRLEQECLFLHIDKFECLQVPFRDICFVTTIKGSGKLCIVCSRDQYNVRGTMLDFIKKLPSQFVRCHNAYIVNLDQIQQIVLRERKIIMRNGCECTYSTFKKALLEKWKSHVDILL